MIAIPDNLPNRDGRKPILFCLAIANIVLAAGCQSLLVNNLPERIIPSNDRNWVADMTRMPLAEMQDRTVTIKNFRNCQYVTDKDFVVNYSDKVIQLDDIQSVDFVVVPFQKTPAIAHTMLTFGLKNGEYLCVSAEIRKEIGENYSPMLGVTNQFELFYVVADEKDLIRLRTRYRNADVYLYPTVADASASQRLFMDVMQRINKLSARPEFYNTFLNNCTTNIADHVNDLSPKKVALLNWQILLPGFSPKYAYDQGLLDQTLPFEELKSIALINELAEQHFEAADFSRKIRTKLSQIGHSSDESQSAANGIDLEFDQ